MRKNIYTIIFTALLIGLCMVFSSCSKDPILKQGDYIYENNDLTKVDYVNGIIINWADDIDINEEQKAVIRNLMDNLVRVEGGSFMMGAQNINAQGDCYDEDALDDESPVHQVTLTNFLIGKYEITQKEWHTIMGYDLDWSELYGEGDDFPAYNVSQTEALQFVERLNAMTRLSFNLPTEAQWEFAAKGGNKSQHYRFSGNNEVDDVAWHKNNTEGRLHPVGEKQANELGLYDMSGNLWEWCLDAYGPYPDEPQTEPVSENGDKFLIRGGSWTFIPTYCRVTARNSYSGENHSISNGFRIILKNN